ncbi:MAG: response regulator, partial [Desulfuromonadales bacterium]|nr:response regulator [Desulfuromonadales bacterium]NIS43448.1 response regulator [Desulfuromonadales bacterium]
EGEGSVFTFVVPVATTVESPVDEQAESGEEETKGDEPSWKVLLVEDDPLISDVMLELFKHRQWRTTLARNGQEALDSCEDQTFDVILMDVQMPDLHGLEVTRRLRSREKQGAPATPIIALTAHAGKSDRERCLEAGMDEVLTKPVKMEELISTIREVVEGQGGP